MNFRKTKIQILLSLSLLLSGATAHWLHAADQEIFVDKDFRAGNLSNAGQNLYVDRKGALRLIHRFDFDGDGFPDILVLNDHNHFETTPAVVYHNEKGQFSSLLPPLRDDMAFYEVLERYAKQRNQQTLLPALGGVAAAAGDFNGDGEPDIVISNFVHGSNLETFPMPVYWGAKEGYTADHRSLLDGFFCEGVAAGDFNGDGIDDILIACRGPEYEAAANQKLPLVERMAKASAAASESYLVFGQKDWSQNPKKKTFPTLYAIDAAAADLDGDGKPEAVFLEAGLPGQVRIFYSSKEGAPSVVLSAGDVQWDVIRSRKIRLADLNGNGSKDILVPEKSGLRVFWNDGKGNFSADRATMLDLKDSYASAVGDFNHDGKPDLAVAVCGEDAPSVLFLNNGKDIEQWDRTLLPSHAANAVEAIDLNHDGFDDLVIANYLDSGKETLDTNSLIYWGGRDGLVPADQTALATFGAVDVIGVPSRESPGFQDLVFVNRQSGRRGMKGDTPTDSGGMPTYIYWGNSRGKYTPGDMTRIPASTSETAAVAADLTRDGHADLVLLPQGGYHAAIYRAEGRNYSLARDIVLPGRGRTPLVADLDKDGALDLIVTSNKEPKAWLYRDVIGVSKPETISLPETAYSSALGDMDGDGHLDLVAVGVGHIFVLYGSANGFDASRSVVIKKPKFFTEVALADLDNDGQLDVVAFAWNDLETGNNRTDSLIFWNKEGRISEDSISPLPTLGGASQGSIADVNDDGWLDIISSNYHGGDTRHLDAQVFLGDGSRTFTRERSQTVPAFSSAANQVMDFNGDGYKDLLVFNHSESSENVERRPLGGKHSTGAWLYWGSENGFSADHRQWIPTYGPHNKINVDPGDILHRHPWEEYLSPSIKIPKSSGAFFLRVMVGPGPAMTIKASVETPDAKGWTELPVASSGKDFYEFGPANLANAQSIRYKIILKSEAPEIRSVKGIVRSAQPPIP